MIYRRLEQKAVCLAKKEKKRKKQKTQKKTHTHTDEKTTTKKHKKKKHKKKNTHAISLYQTTHSYGNLYTKIFDSAAVKRVV